MKCFIGTSGWLYGWNKGKSLDWYVGESGLNAIELNASFYRYPYPAYVMSWAKRGSNLAWVVKVNRLVTHVHRLNEKAYDYFKRFKDLFKPLEEHVHYYLLQLPPSFTKDSIQRIESFVKKFGSLKLAFEFRRPEWFSDDIIKWGKKLGVLIVSVDAPNLPYKVMSKDIIYMRVHGRSAWYSHDYSDEELKEIAKRILEKKPKTVYAFFNNNHAMLKNARAFMRLLKS